MLESVYLALIAVASLCLILSVTIGNEKATKLISKIILAATAVALFSVLAIDSVNIEILYCNSMTCSATSLFYGAYGYIFWALGIISGLIMFIFTIILLIDIWKHGTFRDRYDPNLM